MGKVSILIIESLTKTLVLLIFMASISVPLIFVMSLYQEAGSFQAMPILHVVVTLHYYMPIEFFLDFGFIITVGVLQALLKRWMKFII